MLAPGILRRHLFLLVACLLAPLLLFPCVHTGAWRFSLQCWEEDMSRSRKFVEMGLSPEDASRLLAGSSGWLHRRGSLS